MFLILFSLWHFIHYSMAENGPIVALTTGHIFEGYVFNDSANIFLGIPYAEPPIGELRFQKTQSLKPSNNSESRILCNSYKASCWQNHSLIADERIGEMNEDCLYLNVYSHIQCTADRKCPVLYYIHGGALEFDSPVIYPVDILVENFASKGLVLVTVAYRLGVFGFWTTGNSEASGNYGLYDVLEGLKWVKNEIHSFGGDANEVTIMGQSAGAYIVSLLTLTPKSQGLFKRAILMSLPNMMMNDQISQYENLARSVGCSDLQCMRSVDAKLLIDSYWALEDSLSIDQHATYPRIDGIIFPAQLNVLMKNRRPIDAIIGTTANEKGFQILQYTNSTSKDVSEMCSFVIGNMKFEHEKLLISECEHRYIHGSDDFEEAPSNSTFNIWADRMVQLKNDIFYFGPAFKEASSLSQIGANVFLYSFDYVKTGFEGVGPWHAFDLTYILGTHPFEFDQNDREIRSIYSTLFVNFTKYGHPTNSWSPLRNPPLDMDYLSIDIPQPSMKPRYHHKGVLFWNYVVPSIGQAKNQTKRLFQPVQEASRDASKTDQSDNQTKRLFQPASAHAWKSDQPKKQEECPTQILPTQILPISLSLTALIAVMGAVVFIAWWLHASTKASHYFIMTKNGEDTQLNVDKCRDYSTFQKGM